MCPAVDDVAGICIEACSADEACPGEEMCCYNGCGHVCTAPSHQGKGNSNIYQYHPPGKMRGLYCRALTHFDGERKKAI